MTSPDRSHHISLNSGDPSRLGDCCLEVPGGSTAEQAEFHAMMISHGWLHYDRTHDGLNIYRHDDYYKHAHVSRAGDIAMMPAGPRCCAEQPDRFAEKT